MPSAKKRWDVDRPGTNEQVGEVLGFCRMVEVSPTARADHRRGAPSVRTTDKEGYPFEQVLHILGPHLMEGTYLECVGLLFMFGYLGGGAQT